MEPQQKAEDRLIALPSAPVEHRSGRPSSASSSASSASTLAALRTLCRIRRTTHTPQSYVSGATLTATANLRRDLELLPLSEKMTCRRPRAMLLVGEGEGQVKMVCCGRYDCSNRRKMRAKEIGLGLIQHWTEGRNGKRWVVDFDSIAEAEPSLRHIRRQRCLWKKNSGVGVIPSYVMLKPDQDSDYRILITNVNITGYSDGCSDVEEMDSQAALDYIVGSINRGPIANVQCPDWKTEKPPAKYVVVDPGDYETAVELVEEAGFEVTRRSEPYGVDPDPVLVKNGWASPAPRDVWFTFTGMTQDEAKDLLIKLKDELFDPELDDAYTS